MVFSYEGAHYHLMSAGTVFVRNPDSGCDCKSAVYIEAGLQCAKSIKRVVHRFLFLNIVSRSFEQVPRSVHDGALCIRDAYGDFAVIRFQQSGKVQLFPL